MSDYSDCYYELHKDEIEKENKANNYRERLIDEISHDDMIKIYTHIITPLLYTNIFYFFFQGLVFFLKGIDSLNYIA